MSDIFDHEVDAWDQAIFHPDYVNENSSMYERRASIEDSYRYRTALQGEWLHPSFDEE